jgi:hypothetical protein
MAAADDRPPLLGGAAANPYTAPAAGGGPGGDHAGDAAAGPGLVRHVMPVAILMIIQGAVELLHAVVFLALTVAVPAMLPDLPADAGAAPAGAAASRTFVVGMIMAVYGVMGAGGLIAGVLHVTAGIFGLQFRRRTFGIVALAFGMASITTVSCAPTAIGLAVYGLITYLNPAVVAAFRLGDAGVPAAAIRSRFGV